MADPAVLAGRPAEHLAQGYLLARDGATVRVRLGAGRAWLTVKGVRRGAARDEHECPLSAEVAEALLALCPTVVAKRRHRFAADGVRWEVDVFEGANEGLVMAEVEFADEGAAAAFRPPPWVGREVTDDDRFYNAALAERPFTTWGRAGMAGAPAGKAAPSTIEEAAMREEPVPADAVIDIRTAAEILGVPEAQVDILIDDGLLHVVDGRDEPVLTAAEVLALRGQGG